MSKRRGSAASYMSTLLFYHKYLLIDYYAMCTWARHIL